MFKKGDKVKLVVAVPTGEVADLRFNEAGEIEVLLEWTEGDAAHQRWFAQDALEAV